MKRRVLEEMTARARQLRRDATDVERLLWLRLRTVTPRWTRQLVIGRFIVDLACRGAKLAVELDGSQHIDRTEYDHQRTLWLERQGWRVLRLWNTEVRSNADGAAEYVLSKAAECLGGTHPQPLPCREGRRRPPR